MIPENEVTTLLGNTEHVLNREGWDSPAFLADLTLDGRDLSLTELPVTVRHPADTFLAAVADTMARHDHLTSQLATRVGFEGILFAHVAWGNPELVREFKEWLPRRRRRTVDSTLDGLEVRQLILVDVYGRVFLAQRTRDERCMIGSGDLLSRNGPTYTASLARMVYEVAKYLPEHRRDLPALEKLIATASVGQS